MKTAIELLDGMAGGLFLYRADEQVLELVANYNEMNPIGSKLQLNQGLAGAVWLSDTPMIVDNYRKWPRHIPDFVSFIGDRSLIGIALQRGDERLGVLTMVGRDGRSYNQHDVELLNLFTAGATIAIQNARLHNQQRQTEIALRESETAARVLLNAPPDDFFLLDKSGLIIDLNETAAQNLNQPVSDLIHQVNVYDLFAENVAAARRQAVEQVLVTGTTSHFEDRRNGRWYVNSIYPIFDSLGQSVRVAVYARDVTDEKAAAAERESLIADLEAKNDELERFTYTVSHDLKSPLVTVRGFLGYLERDLAQGKQERVQSDITRIREATDKMQTLLNDLLQLSRIGRLVNPAQEVAFNELAEEAVKLVSGQIEAKGVRVEIVPDMPRVQVDWLRLVEVIQNLLDNAVKFMGDQPEPMIKVGVRQKNDQTVFFVQDNGIGIAPKYHEDVFGLFDRLNPAIEGTGIGLALVKRIIETHGGRIWVESAAGEGATFCFTLNH
jgi:signal transduction histidine kinase